MPSNAILRGLMCDIQNAGDIRNVREILALRPILNDLARFGNVQELDAESLRTGLFRERDFEKLCCFDMDSAEKSIVIYSGFITPERCAALGDLFRRKIELGVKIRCITRPPDRNGSIPQELGEEALRAIENIGVVIDLRNEIHEKVVTIDNRIVWFGSLNPLSHSSRTSELMARINDTGVAAHLVNILAVRPIPSDNIERMLGIARENPTCPNCQSWTVYCRGRFGPFFACSKRCGWRQSVDSPYRRN
ncbi:MAG: phospholipase D-like domain-containing protein [Planctomycetaceae bacterium]